MIQIKPKHIVCGSNNAVVLICIPDNEIWLSCQLVIEFVDHLEFLLLVVKPHDAVLICQEQLRFLRLTVKLKCS